MTPGFLLTLPLESVAVRVVVASAAGVLLLRLLLRAGVRSVRARIAMALAPAIALIAVMAWSWRGGWHLPALMLPADAVDALPIPVADGYLHFAPIAAPLLVAGWALVAVTRLLMRLATHRRARRTALDAIELRAAPAPVVAMVARISSKLRLTAPPVAVAETCAGGAYVVGTRRPVIVIGADLLDRLDEEELEGVLAHELAHVRRRDNAVATALGTVRDLMFFVPGGGWAVSQLHRERERAADQVAVRATGRPGALASGLLKTVGGARTSSACAALAPSAALVERVTDLIEDTSTVSRTRRTVEVSAVAMTTVVAVAVALVLPATLAGAERQRDAVALVWALGGTTTAAEASTLPDREARVFDVYRSTPIATPEERPQPPARVEESGIEDRASTWRACATPASCPVRDHGVGLGLVPKAPIRLDDDLPWQATPAFRGGATGEALRLPSVYWLQRVD